LSVCWDQTTKTPSSKTSKFNYSSSSGDGGGGGGGGGGDDDDDDDDDNNNNNNNNTQLWKVQLRLLDELI